VRGKESQGGLITGQKSAEGILGHVAGEASEALRCRKAKSTDRPSRKTVVEGPNESRGKQGMSLRSEIQQNIQTELNFSSTSAGEGK
jgi:hypothetical protein